MMEQLSSAAAPALQHRATLRKLAGHTKPTANHFLSSLTSSTQEHSTPSQWYLHDQPSAPFAQRALCSARELALHSLPAAAWEVSER